jgi:hypothetical protein
MSQGLCMFDAQQRLLVCNSQYADLYHLSPEQTKPGTTMRPILDPRIASGNAPGDHATYLADRLAEVTQNHAHRSPISSRTAATGRPPAESDGGWVATHEDRAAPAVDEPQRQELQTRSSRASRCRSSSRTPRRGS